MKKLKILIGILALLIIALSWLGFTEHQQHEKLVNRIESRFAMEFLDLESDLSGLTNGSEYPNTSSQSWRTLAVDTSNMLQSITFLLTNDDLPEKQYQILSSIQGTLKYFEPFISDSWNFLFGHGDIFEISYCPDEYITISSGEDIRSELLKLQQVFNTVEQTPGTANEFYEEIINQWDSSMAYEFSSCQL